MHSMVCMHIAHLTFYISKFIFHTFILRLGWESVFCIAPHLEDWCPHDKFLDDLWCQVWKGKVPLTNNLLDTNCCVVHVIIVKDLYIIISNFVVCRLLEMILFPVLNNLNQCRDFEKCFDDRLKTFFLYGGVVHIVLVLPSVLAESLQFNQPIRVKY